MQKYAQNSRGLTLTFNMPQTAAEFDALTQPGQCIENANAQVVYRTFLPKAWKTFLERAESLVGIARKVKGTATSADGVVTETYEDDKSYIAAIFAATPKTTVQSHIQSIIDSWEGFDISKAGRSKKPEKMFMDKAEQFAARVLAGAGTWDAFVANSAARGAVTELVFDEEGNVDIESVARRLQEVALNDDLG